ncbi:sensor histidine kinase [Paenibacillus filicis]|uniref:histidine kinase n=1 Tax=Paenibacillus gyeongsangnamensis TaxID=3388067 RepID=A0ABT4QGU5_9BACL|nr:sensor histidine kinase [Paenibacillus filicis]MCZ8515905.1 sensor histidine kinase [Paenibacillus filicis]
MIRMFMFLGLTWITALAGSLTFLYARSESQLRQEAERQGRIWQAYTVKQVEQTVAELDRIVRALSGDYAVRRYAESGFAREGGEAASMKEHVETLIKQQTSQFPFINELCLSHISTKSAICNKPSPDSRPLSFFSLPALSRSDRGVLMLAAMPGDGTQSPQELVYAAPLLDRSNNVIAGVVSVSLNPSYWLKEAFPTDPHLRFDLTDSNGAVIYRHDGGQERTNGLPNVESAANGGSDNGKIALVTQLGLSQAAWTLTAEVEPVNPLADRRNVLWTSLIALLMSSLVAASGALLYRRTFAAPLGKLRALMKRAESGDWNAYWVGKSIVEVEALAESYNQMLNRLEELIRQVKREEALKKEAELEALRYQLNPHFLYNTLNTIKWVAKLNRTPLIAEAVTALVRLLQASLGKKGDFIEVREEIGLLQDYMEIQRFRYGDKIVLKCEMEPEAGRCLLPCLLLQPLVENAIVHGIEPAKREGIISVRIGLDMPRQLLLCHVEDNGLGMAPERQGDEASEGSRMRERMSGIGLKHIREKIRLYYGPGYNMHMASKPGEGTTVRLTLPMHMNGG